MDTKERDRLITERRWASYDRPFEANVGRPENPADPSRRSAEALEYIAHQLWHIRMLMEKAAVSPGSE